MVTIFRRLNDIMNPYFIDVDVALQRIREGKSRAIIEQVRMNPDKSDVFKKMLPAVVFAGESRKAVDRESKKNPGQWYKTKRTDESVTEHSGYFALDLDDVPDHDELVRLLNENPYVYAHWVSPSGYPKRKAIVKCERDLTAHDEMYQAFIDEHPELRLDTTSRNIGRLCFESWDPDLVVKSDVKKWTKRAKVRDESKEDDSVSSVNTRQIQTDYNKIAIAAHMIRRAEDGQKHNELLKASRFLGGCAARGWVSREEAFRVLFEEIKRKDNVSDLEQAKITIQEGFENGLRDPISEVKKTEREQHYFVRDDGEYNYMADMPSIHEELKDRRVGNIKMGRTTGSDSLDDYFRHKENQFNIFLGLDNVGKSTMVWYLAILDSLYNDTRWMIHSNENLDADIFDDLMSMYAGKKIEAMNELEFKRAYEWVRDRFDIVSGEKDVYSHAQMLDMCANQYDKKGPYDVVMIEPWNSFIRKGDELKMDKYEHSIYTLSQYNLFKKSYCSVYSIMHAVTGAARDKVRQKDGEDKRVRPKKYHADGGQIIPNRADDFLVIDRDIKNPDTFMTTEIHVDKIKRVKTGGRPTFEDSPIRFDFIKSGVAKRFGFTDNAGVDCVESFKNGWNQNSQQTIKEVRNPYPEDDDDLDDLPF